MILKAEQVSKKYFRKRDGANWFYAVSPLSMTLESGKVAVLCGRSGSGKTTLLHMLSGLLMPSEGTVCLDDTDLYRLPDGELSRLRCLHIGVVPQARCVLDTLTVMENILLPQTFYHAEILPEIAEQWMERLQIRHLADVRAKELSGGELRRMMIVRAMCTQPPLILADEPTGDLDDGNTERVFRCFRRAADDGAAVLIVSHETDAVKIADCAYRMDGGKLTVLAA